MTTMEFISGGLKALAAVGAAFSVYAALGGFNKKVTIEPEEVAPLEDGDSVDPTLESFNRDIALSKEADLNNGNIEKTLSKLEGLQIICSKVLVFVKTITSAATNIYELFGRQKSPMDGYGQQRRNHIYPNLGGNRGFFSIGASNEREVICLTSASEGSPYFVQIQHDQPGRGKPLTSNYLVEDGDILGGFNNSTKGLPEGSASRVVDEFGREYPKSYGRDGTIYPYTWTDHNGLEWVQFTETFMKPAVMMISQPEFINPSQYIGSGSGFNGGGRVSFLSQVY